MFNLVAVSSPGHQLVADAREINLAAGILADYGNRLPLATYHMSATSRDPMFRRLPAKIRTATAAQIARWPELAAERDRIATLPAYDWRGRTISLLWVRADK